MKRTVLLTGILAFSAAFAAAQTTTWVPDKTHSEVDFSVIHLSLTKVHGRFGNIGGTIVMNSADISKSTVNMTIDVTTEDSGESARDSVVKESTFFNAAQFPTATFVSTAVAKTADGLTVNGNLTLHGVTKPVTLDVEGPTGPVRGVDQKQHEGWSATATLSRTAFGIGTNYPQAVVGDEVKLTIDLEVVKQ